MSIELDLHGKLLSSTVVKEEKLVISWTYVASTLRKAGLYVPIEVCVLISGVDR